MFRYKSFRFFFYSNEGSPREPVHVLVRAGGSEAKIWLKLQAVVATSYGYDAGRLRELVDVAQTNSQLIERAWHDCFG